MFSIWTESLHFFAELIFVWGSCHCRPNGSQGREREGGSWRGSPTPSDQVLWKTTHSSVRFDVWDPQRFPRQLTDRLLTLSPLRDPRLRWRPVPRGHAGWRSLPTGPGCPVRSPAPGRAPPSGFPTSFPVRPPSLSHPSGAEAFALEVGMLLPQFAPSSTQERGQEGITQVVMPATLP